MSAFLKNQPGTFVTVNERAPVLTVWNVSQPAPLELIKVPNKKCGMTAVKSTAVASQFLLSFTDGSVAVFDVQLRKSIYSSQPGHSETIFDCQLRPDNAEVLDSVLPINLNAQTLLI